MLSLYFKYPKDPFDHGLIPGKFRIVYGTRSFDGPSKDSLKRQYYTKNDIVQICEIKILKDEKRVRGKIYHSGSWISLICMETGHRWVEPIEPRAVVVI